MNGSRIVKGEFIMEHFELVEKLVNTFGVSYEEAKNALETSNWDPVEAAVLLEKGKNTPKEEKRKFSFDGFSGQEKMETPSFLKNIWSFFSDNAVLIKKNTGEVFLDIPLWLAIILVCAFFWPIACILVLVMIMGYRVSLKGPQFDKFNAKGSAEKAEPVKEDVVEKVPAEEEIKVENAAESIIENAVKNTENSEEAAEEQKDSSEPQA